MNRLKKKEKKRKAKFLDSLLFYLYYDPVLLFTTLFT